MCFFLKRAFNFPPGDASTDTFRFFLFFILRNVFENLLKLSHHLHNKRFFFFSLKSFDAYGGNLRCFMASIVSEAGGSFFSSFIFNANFFFFFDFFSGIASQKKCFNLSSHLGNQNDPFFLTFRNQKFMLMHSSDAEFATIVHHSFFSSFTQRLANRRRKMKKHLHSE